MFPTNAAVAGVEVLSKLLDTTFAPGITGSSFSGKPATNAPTAAVVPGEAVGLAGAVADACPVTEAEALAVPVAVAPGLAGVHAARASTAPATITAQPAGLSFPITFTGTFLLVLTPDAASSLVSTTA
jgi:hypothetical protein